MEDLRVNGFVLRAVDYSESDKLLTLLTPERGRILVKIKGCKAIKSKLRFAASPFNLGEYFLVSSSGKLIVTGCNQTESFHSAAEEPERYAAAAVITETAEKLTPENEAAPAFYLTAVKLMSALCYSGANPFLIAVKAVISFMDLAGYGISAGLPAGEEQAAYKYFSMSAGQPVKEASRLPNDPRISPVLPDLLTVLIRIQPEGLADCAVEKGAVLEAVKLIGDYFTYQTDYKLRSIGVLTSFIAN